MVCGRNYAMKVCLPIIGAFCLVSAYIGSCQKRTHEIPEAAVSFVEEDIFHCDMGSSPVYKAGLEGYGETFFFSDWEEGVGNGDTVRNVKYRHRPFSGGEEAAVLKAEF